MGRPPDAQRGGNCEIEGVRRAHPPKTETKEMLSLRKFRATARNDRFAETAEVNRILRKGPNDLPAGVRHNHASLRMMGGW